MRPTRRDVLRGGLYSGALLATGGVAPLFYPRRASAAPRPVDPRGTTLERTIRLGTPGAGGYMPIVSGPAEPHLLREDLKTAARSGRAERRTPLLVFVQFTDIHIIDAQSPARVEFLDRYSDDPFSQTPFSSAYRPQEMLTTQIADSLVHAVRRVGRGPVTGAPFAFTICTGDNIDNAQYNELRWYIDVLDGGRVVPDSGDTTQWEGIHDQEPVSYDVHYWHPDGTPDRPGGGVDDHARRLFGFPVVKGLLDAARRPFDALGLDMPWYAVFGNHDPLMQGNAPGNVAFGTIATGRVKVVGLTPGLSPADALTGIIQNDPDITATVLAGPARPITADPDRRVVTRPQIVAEHFTTTGTPVGHGFRDANKASGVGYYGFEAAPLVRGIVLDTVNYGYADGSIDRPQLEWLESELVANSRKQLDAAGALVPAGGRDRLMVVFSHHPIDSMENPFIGPGETQQRVFGGEVAALLQRFPNVIAWVNGHTHRNDVIPRLRGGGGFWELSTAAHVDFPHQARLLELVDNHDGTLSIFATLIDADAPLAFGGRLDTPQALASLGRELGGNDWHHRLHNGLGPIETHNVELIVAAPFDLRTEARRPPTAVPRPRPPGPGNGGAPDGGLAATGPAGSRERVGAALALAAAGLAVSLRRSVGEPDGDASA